MRYAVVFAALGGLLALQAFRVPPWYGWAFAWAAVSCLLVAAAYAGLGPRVFGKRPDGRLAWWSRLLLAPYLAFYRLLWHLVRVIGREPASHEVSPGVYLGRRPLPADLPPGVTRVVDLCVEFPGTPVPSSHRYVALPTLDAGLAHPGAFRSLVAEVAADDSPIYVHCASGHGRGAMFATALLIARGLAPDIDAAETMIRNVRPGVRLSRAQGEFVRRTMTPRQVSQPHVE